MDGLPNWPRDPGDHWYPGPETLYEVIIVIVCKSQNAKNDCKETENSYEEKIYYISPVNITPRPA